jgi:3-oxoacyl-[acyl-carrier-protein] synthase-1
VTPIYLQRASLRCALGDSLDSASAALRRGHLPVPQWFDLHELHQPRPYLPAQGGDGSLAQRLDRTLHELLGTDGAPDDSLLIVASTTLDIADIEAQVSASGAFDHGMSTSLDLLAEQLRGRWGFASAFTLNTACTSAANGLLYGARLLAAGYFNKVVLLSFETRSALARQGFGALDLTSPSGRYRPFHPERDGLILGEAYAAVLLAAEPGEAPLARLLGGFSACDTSNLTTTRGDGSHIDWVMQRALRSAGLSTSDIALAKLHGTATGANDHAESNGMRRLFGERLPPLCVLKPWLGHTLGACGLVETLLLVGEGELPAVDYADQALLPLPAEPITVGVGRLLLANFFGFGGNNASLVLQGTHA